MKLTFKDREIQEKGEKAFREGLEYLIEGDFTNSLKLFDEALQKFKSASWPNVQSIARTMHHIGIVHKECSRLSDAIKIFEESLSFQRKYAEPNYYRQANTLRSLGAAYELCDKIDKALECYEDSLEMQKKITPLTFEAKYQNNSQVNKIDPIMAFLLKANTLYSIGSIYAKQNKFTLAIESYNECLKVQRAFKLKPGYYFCLSY